jgi:hypothetical protein
MRQQQELQERRRKRQERRRKRGLQVLEQELPRELVLEQERVLPSCRKRRVLQQRSGRPERGSSSFGFS